MHPIMAKLITLERVEAFGAFSWPKGAQSSFREQSKLLRGELPPHVLRVFDRLKAEGKEAVVGVFEKKCGGCQAPLSKGTLALLSRDTELSHCPMCSRFIYLSGSVASETNMQSQTKGPKYAA